MQNSYEGGVGTLQQVVALGTSTVVTQTKIVGSIPKKCRCTSVRFYGQGAVTATTLTAEVFVRTTAGATGVSLQSAAKSVKFGTTALAKAGVSASFSTVSGDKYGATDQLLEVTITADTCSAGPGDLLVEVRYEPRSG